MKNQIENTVTPVEIPTVTPIVTENRDRKIAGEVLAKKGFLVAVAALSSLDETIAARDGRALAATRQALREALRTAGLYGRVRETVSAAFKEVQRVGDELAEERALEIFERFMDAIDTAHAIVECVDEMPPQGRPRMVKYAQQRLERAGEIFFPGFVLGALERLTTKEGPVVELLKNSERLAVAVAAAPQGQRADTLLRELKTGAVARVTELAEKMASEVFAYERAQIKPKHQRPLKPGELSGIRAKGKTQRDKENRRRRAGKK